jgi:hypothetical protein
MTRYEEIRALSQRVSTKHPELAAPLDSLRSQGDQQLALMKGLAGSIGPVDLLLGAIVGRSLDVLGGFADAFDRWNVTVASVLVRLQVDNVLLAHVNLTTPDPDGLLAHLVADKRMASLVVPEGMASRLRPKDRKRFTDQTMRWLASQEHPWIDDVYTKASGWVHFSSIHYANVWKFGDDGSVFARWPLDVEQFGVDFLAPMLQAMLVATCTVTDYLRLWVAKKTSNPCGLGPLTQPPAVS